MGQGWGGCVEECSHEEGIRQAGRGGDSMVHCRTSQLGWLSRMVRDGVFGELERHLGSVAKASYIRPIGLEQMLEESRGGRR